MDNLTKLRIGLTIGAIVGFVPITLLFAAGIVGFFIPFIFINPNPPLVTLALIGACVISTFGIWVSVENLCVCNGRFASSAEHSSSCRRSRDHHDLGHAARLFHSRASRSYMHISDARDCLDGHARTYIEKSKSLTRSIASQSGYLVVIALL